jgi:hypothetical protein
MRLCFQIHFSICASLLLRISGIPIAIGIAAPLLLLLFHLSLTAEFRKLKLQK